MTPRQAEIAANILRDQAFASPETERMAACLAAAAELHRLAPEPAVWRYADGVLRAADPGTRLALTFARVPAVAAHVPALLNGEAVVLPLPDRFQLRRLAKQLEGRKLHKLAEAINGIEYSRIGIDNARFISTGLRIRVKTD